jgi:SAM-dependent methyltransferase
MMTVKLLKRKLKIVWWYLRGKKMIIPSLIANYCTGSGLEIGPGKKPYCDPRNTKYLDKHLSHKDGCTNPDIVATADQIPSPDGAFDYVFSSHCLEHVPNTLKVLREWVRVLKSSGVLFLVLPHGDRTFDRCRAKTSLAHHISDQEVVGCSSSDPTHFEEMKTGWIADAGSNFEGIKDQYEKGWGAPMWDFDFRVENDVLHYHVWTQDEMIEVLKYMKLKIVYACEIVPEREDSFVVIARKP